MYYKLYIDSFFILQMTGNLYLLSLAGKILGCTATHVRIWLGAAAGASIACMAVLVPVWPVWARILAGAVPGSMCMLRITYRIHGGRNLIHGSLVMAGCGFFSGSIMIWILNRLRTVLNGRIGIVLTIVSGYLAYRILLRLIRVFGRKRENCIREVSVYVPKLQRNLHMQAFLDTGNHLADPVSGAPVCVVSRKLAQELQSCFKPEKYHAIPYRSVGTESGILHAWELPEMMIGGQGGEVRKEHVIVAVCDAGISKESVCQMLLNPRLLEN